MQVVNDKTNSRCVSSVALLRGLPAHVNSGFEIAKAIGPLFGSVLCLSAMAQIPPTDVRDTASRNEQEWKRQLQKEQQQRQQLERVPDVRLTAPETVSSQTLAQASVSLANNGGDIGKTLKDLGSSNAVKNTLVAMATASVGTSIAGQGVSAVVAQTAAGCATGALTGAGCEQGAKTAAVLSTAGEAYQSLVGYAANAGPGENRNGTNLDGTSTGNGTYQPFGVEHPNSGQQQAGDRGMNVIGYNKLVRVGAQGGTLSRALNQVPTINATAGLHDYICIDSNTVPTSATTTGGTQ